MAKDKVKDPGGKKLPVGITLRKDGRYMWRFKYNGVSYTGYARNLTDAKTGKRNKQYEVENGLYSKEKNTSFDAWFVEWMEVYAAAVCKDSTLNTYRNTYQRYIKPVFGSKRMKNIRADMIQRFTNTAAATYSKTVASTINFLMFDSLRQAARNGIIAKNPMENTTPPKFKTQEKRKALSMKDQKLFLEAAQESRYYNLYRMITLTGMRVGELLGLQWHDVDFKAGEIHIEHTLVYESGRGLYLSTPKSAASRRIIPIGGKESEAYQILREWRIEQKRLRMLAGPIWKPLPGFEDTVFTTEIGTPHYDTNIRKDMKDIAEQLKAEGHEIGLCTPHILRHCFATRCIENGMDPKVLQAILGHSTFAMTMDLYVDVMEESKKDELEKIRQAL